MISLGSQYGGTPLPGDTTQYVQGYTGGSTTGVTSLSPYTQDGLTYPNGGYIPGDTTTTQTPIDQNQLNLDQAAAQKTAQQNLLRQGLNTGIANLEGQLQVLTPQEQAAKLRVNNQFGTTNNRLTQDFNTGQQNLQRATGDVSESKERSLYNLRDWMRGMGQGYSNQLGTMGAGNSSATDLINFALGKQGSRERGNIMQDAQGQLENIDLQGEQLQVDFGRATEDLNKWKENSLFDITSQYQSARDQINNSILDARARAAAEMELTQEAVSYLSQLENQYRTQAGALQGQYQQLANPQSQINQSLLNFSTTPVQQANLNGIGMPTAVNPESGVTAFNRRRDDELLSNPLGV